MTSRAFLLASIAALISNLGCAPAMVGAPRAPSRVDSILADQALQTILLNHWRHALEAHTEYALWSGSRTDRLPSVTVEGAKADASFGRAVRRALADVNVDALSEDAYISWLALEWEMDLLGQSSSYYWTDLSALSVSRSPLRAAFQLLQRDSIAQGGDAQWHLALVDAFANLVDSVRISTELRASRGVVMPRLVLPRAIHLARSLLAPRDSSPFRVLPNRVPGLDRSSWTQFDSLLAEAIATRVNPSLERLIQYLEGPYSVTAPERPGLAQFVGGKEHYRFLLRQYSTLDISPEDAHAIGLREVAALDSAAGRARQQSGLPRDRDSLRTRIHTDARYAAHSANTILDRFLAEYSRVASVVGRAFGRAPELSTDLQAMAPAAESFGDLGTYEPPSVADPQAHYRFNSTRWEDRSLFTAPAVVHGDLLPGRHYQASLQRENPALPAFRRLSEYAGYVEGWRAYAIALGDSLTTNQDPERHLAAVMVELSMACGLVVDTGVHYFGWTRDQALQFLRAHLLEADDELERDILIPVVELPGSLTAATLGVRELRGMRHWVERELGDRFDLRAFHDEVLSLGAVPLPVLGKHLEWWIWRAKEQGRGPRSEVRGQR